MPNLDKETSRRIFPDISVISTPMAMRIVFIGPPGSGKGTQAAKLVQAGFVHLSTGELLRREIASGSTRGMAIADTVHNGKLVPDEIVFDLIDDFLRIQPHCSLVFDGYPRTLSQAQRLQSVGIDAACFFQVADEVVLRRLGNRVIGSDGTIYDLELYPPPPGAAYARRIDDTSAVHRNRLREYRERETWLREFYRKQGFYHEIQASLPAECITENILNLLKTLAIRR